MKRFHAIKLSLHFTPHSLSYFPLSTLLLNRFLLFDDVDRLPAFVKRDFHKLLIELIRLCLGVCVSRSNRCYPSNIRYSKWRVKRSCGIFFSSPFQLTFSWILIKGNKCAKGFGNKSESAVLWNVWRGGVGMGYGLLSCWEAHKTLNLACLRMIFSILRTCSRGDLGFTLFSNGRGNKWVECCWVIYFGCLEWSFS